MLLFDNEPPDEGRNKHTAIFGKLGIGDKALIAQFGKRLPEGTKKLPEGAELNFFFVSLV